MRLTIPAAALVAFPLAAAMFVAGCSSPSSASTSTATAKGSGAGAGAVASATPEYVSFPRKTAKSASRGVRGRIPFPA